MKKKISILFMSVVLMLAFASTELLAKVNNSKDSLVALGDSIPFGYNLENNNNHASKEAYPALIGEEADLRVRNLGEPGWTTTDLLDALENDEKFRQAIRHADYVTLSIGNNDLLGAFQSLLTTTEGQMAISQFQAAPTPENLQAVQAALGIPGLLDNLDQIVAEIQSLSDAEIIFYNIYNPFFNFHFNEYYEIGNLLLNDFYGVPGINTLITDTVSSENVTVADAFSAFDNDTYLIDGDIHPTSLGQEKLAEIGYQALIN